MKKKRSSQEKKITHPFENLPRLSELRKNAVDPAPPDDEKCFQLWQKYEMLPNIRRHSLMVAHIATALAQRAVMLNIPVSVEAVRAAGLLHDIAKTWCLKYGGSHAMIGSAWTVQETHHFGIAQGVLLHVHWPWALPKNTDICALPFFVLYADKRVRHDVCVTLTERFEDLLVRYGATKAARAGIRYSWKQAKNLEHNLSTQLGWDLHENSFNCGRLVP